MHHELAVDHAVVPGLARYAGKDVERWDAEKGAFMRDHGAQSEFEKAVVSTGSGGCGILVLDSLPVLANAVAKPTKHFEAQPRNGKPLILPRFLEHPTFEISASSAPGAERVQGLLRSRPIRFGCCDVSLTGLTARRNRKKPPICGSWMLVGTEY